CGGDLIADVDAAPAPGCNYADKPSSLDRGCMIDGDCVVVERQVSCCKVEEDGIRGDAGAGFLAQQQSSTKKCVTCGCDPQPVDESGVAGSSFTATCDNHLCTSHAH